MYGPIPQVVWIHPEDARRLDIEGDDVVTLHNALAKVTLRAEVTDRIAEGCLWAPRPLIGLNGVPLNSLVPDSCQAIGNGPIFNSVEVKIDGTV